MNNWKNLFPKKNIYYQTDNGILYKGNCLEIMKEFPENSIDLVITDPPYGINYENWDKEIEFELFFKIIKHLSKENFSLFIFSGWTNVCKVVEEGKFFFNLKDWIIWDRIKGRGTKKSLVSTREDILWFVNNRYIFNKYEAYTKIKKITGGFGNKNNKKTRALSNVWTDISPVVPWSNEKVNHPTQKPLELIERIIKVFSNKNNLILDPFMGSGTIAIACEKLNRRWIGIELEEKYCEITKQRIEKEIKQPKLF